MPRPNLAEYNRQKAMQGNWRRIYDVMQESPNMPLYQIAARTGVSLPTVTRARKAIELGWKPNMGEKK